MIKNFSFVFVLFLSIQLHAQKSFDFGIRANLITTQIDGDGYGGFNKAGIRLGLFTHREFSSKWSGELGIGFVQKGSQRPGTEDNLNLDYYKIALNYAEIPIVAKYAIRDFFVLGGLSANVLLSHEEEDFSGTTPNSLNVNTVEVSYLVGAEYYFGNKLIAEAGMVNSLSPMADSLEPVNFGLFGGSYHVAVFFGLKYRFRGLQ